MSNVWDKTCVWHGEDSYKILTTYYYLSVNIGNGNTRTLGQLFGFSGTREVGPFEPNCI